MNLEWLKVFNIVAEKKNITKASQELMISQPAISKCIKNLEDQLECKLLIRNKTGVILTKKGEILYECSKKINQEIENTLNEIKRTNEEIKTLNIAVGKTLSRIYILPYIEKFQKDNPNTIINIFNSNEESIYNKIKNNQIDLIIGYDSPNTPKNLIQIPLKKSIHPIFVGNNKFKDLSINKIKLEELNSYPLIFSAKGSTTRSYLDHFLYYKNIELIPMAEVLGTSMCLEFVKNGIGISIFSKEIIENELNSKELYEIKTTPSLPSRSIYIKYLKDKPLSIEAKNFINEIQN